MSTKFLFPNPNLNYSGVIVAFVLSNFLGFAWFGALFGKTWLQNSRWTQKKMDANKSEMSMSLVGTFLLNGVMAFVLSNFIQSLEYDLCDSLTLAFYFWVGFILTSSIHTVLWEGERPIFFAINAFYKLAILLLQALAYHGVRYLYAEVYSL